jgi:hypothetical protein
MSDTPPPAGQMYLYDNITPPLSDGSYRWTASTDTKIDGTDQNLPGATNYFNVEGPRFTLTPSLVSGVFPPRNGHGSFQETIPHIALARRTLPWERALDPGGLIGTPTVSQGDPARPVGPPPWLALLLFEEGEYTILQNQPLESVVPSAVYARLGSPPNINCDAVNAPLSVLRAIMPSLDELTVLSHVREVNTDDRDLSAGSSDGWFSVVMSNRVAAPNSKCCACLVSLEERSDLILRDPPENFSLPDERPLAIAEKVPAATTSAQSNRSQTPPLFPGQVFPYQITVSLVLLYSWKFECIGSGSFRDLMQGLDVAMFGVVDELGHPPVADTGHIKVPLGDRAGVEETVLYRSPLTPFRLTRDPLGPYHSADQCRRVAPEAGAEDVTYACAFEVGRLLAAADARLAQELMRWRREGYRQSARSNTFGAVSAALPMVAPLDVHTPAVPVVAASATTSILAGRGPSADPFGLSTVTRVIGLQPAAVREAWQLTSIAEAATILGADPGALGATVAAPVATPRVATTIAAVAADSFSLTNLSAARDRLIANTAQKVGTP